MDAFFATVVLGPLERELTDPKLPPLERLRKSFVRRIAGYRAIDFRSGCLLGNLALEIADESEPVRERLAVNFRKWVACIATCPLGSAGAR